MYFPVRCFTCGKVIGHLYEKYLDDVSSGKDKSKVLDNLNVKRICCRRMFLSHVDISHKIIKYRKF
ncbi:MAG: DNA-directed RNA polymerase subunit N [Candidatus Micrarchaeota archaeon]|nr:DNA-directed RNA polymerase subunit N [Candidatus Micrarchaeota archaeon]